MQRPIVLGCGIAVAGLFFAWRLVASRRRLAWLLGDNILILDKEERKMAMRLLASGNTCVLAGWPRRGFKDAQKKRLVRRAAQHLDNVAAKVSPERVAALQAPACVQKPHQVVAASGTRPDAFYWLRDDARENPEVLAVLAAENAYCAHVLSDTEKLQASLYAEMRSRIQEADRTVPVLRGKYYRYSDTLEGKQYSVHKRRLAPLGEASSADDSSVPEEVLLDENVQASQHKFYSLGALAVSEDDATIAFAEDTDGSEKYSVSIKTLATGKLLLSNGIQGTSGDLVWAADSRTLFYVLEDDARRPFQVWRHTVGTDPTADVKVFEEDDDAFYVHLGKSRDKQLLFISSSSSVSSETRYVAAAEPASPFKVMLPREDDVEYDAEHWKGFFIMVKRTPSTPNSEIVVAPVSDPAQQRTLQAHDAAVKIEDIAVSERFIAVFVRAGGLQQAYVYPLPGDGNADAISLASGRKIDFGEAAYELGLAAQNDFDSDVLAIAYTSLTTPPTTYWFNMSTQAMEVKKVKPVLGGFNKANYVTERIWASAPDGVKIPISIVYNKHLAKLDGSDPLHLYVYGAYEVCIDAAFSANRLSLLDRGITFAIAHVRGGGEMGRQWYEDGKFLKKKNTFTDTVACAEHLIAQRWTHSQLLTLEGRSAGGLTTGAVANMRPDLFQGIVMGVPFVDCLTTMLDRSIPLTVLEFDEWGNPENQEYYDYMLTYSPVDNVKAQAYPNILVTAGLNDPRVAYWEPAKFVAKLRLLKTDSNILAFKCNMGSGHSGDSGRFDRLKEVALDQAFVIKCAQRMDVEPFTSA